MKYRIEIYENWGKEVIGDFSRDRTDEIVSDLRSKGAQFNVLRIEEDGTIEDVSHNF